MKRKRIFIVDEMMESCRLMPNWIQMIFYFIIFVISYLIVPAISHIFLWVIITLQLIFIILLTNKNVIYRRISRIEVATKKMVIWVHSKRDEGEKNKKALINLALIIVTVFLFYKLQDFRLLIINGLFCLLFSLKLIFYVPLISIRIIDNDKDLNKFLVIDKGVGMNTEIYLCEIDSLEIKSDKLEVDTSQGKLEIPLDFRTEIERRKLKLFLTRINKFEIR